MASATATANSRPTGRRRRRENPFWRGSRLGRTIIALNVIGLLVLVGGALILNETRRALSDAQEDALITEGGLISQFLTAMGATQGVPDPVLDAELSRQAVHLFAPPPTQRVRIFDAQGAIVADSQIINDRIEQTPLPNLRRPGGIFKIAPKGQGETRNEIAARRELEAEVREAMAQDYASGPRRTPNGGRVVSVSLAIKHVGAVLGVLTIEGEDVDAIIRKQRAALLPFIIIAALGTIASSLLLNLVIALPVRRLSRAADLVRLSRARSISLPEISSRDDELGDLARSLETMTQAQSERMDAIERFAADVAHEIRNPLTSIRSAVETLDLVKDAAARERLLAILKQDVARLDRLITDISNASRLDAELSREESRVLDLGRLIGDIVSVYEGSGRKTDAPVVFQAPAAPAMVAGREVPLSQVIRNLIDNARSFTQLTGRKNASVRIAVRLEEGQVVTTVEDDGPGIPPENLEMIFERFYTSRPRETKTAGGAGNSGLGLSIARQIILAHNGRLWAENRLGDDGEILGARFTIVLPAQAAS
jgi:two-component system sensor histidine kinase ChvG